MKTAEDKANELIERFINASNIFIEYPEDRVFQESVAIKCAIIHVQEVLNILFQHHEIDYYKKVKQTLTDKLK